MPQHGLVTFHAYSERENGMKWDRALMGIAQRSLCVWKSLLFEGIPLFSLTCFALVILMLLYNPSVVARAAAGSIILASVFLRWHCLRLVSAMTLEHGRGGYDIYVVRMLDAIAYTVELVSVSYVLVASALLLMK
jgi:hypothetical protein